MNWHTQPDALALLFLLSTLEIVLSVDNHALVTTMTDRLDENRRRVVHAFAFGGTLLMRTVLLVALFKIMQFHTLAISVFGETLQPRQLVLIFGGAFLIIKSAKEIVAHVMNKQVNPPEPISTQCLLMTAQIIVIDVILSIDSMMAAVAVANDLRIIVVALVTAQLVMMAFGHKIQELLYSAPTLETVALVVLHAVGWISVMEGSGTRVSESYLFVAVAFATVIELINLKLIKEQAKAKESTSNKSNKKTHGRAKETKTPQRPQLPLTR